jgi:periplasmic divalent cation tolerance protein
MNPPENPAIQDVALLYVTCPDVQVASHIARTLVEERRVACANILGQMRSVYRWDGHVMEVDEVAMLLKATRAQEADIVARVRALHPYENPAILTLPILGGAPEFLTWIVHETAAEISD